MEDVLDVYHRPYDPARPQVCLDETSKQLLEHTRTPLPATAGTPARVDDEYKRCGTANIFAAIEPLTGALSPIMRQRGVLTSRGDHDEARAPSPRGCDEVATRRSRGVASPTDAVERSSAGAA
jgi:hypothetical protein